MIDLESELIDSIFERISSGVQIDSEELNSLLEGVNRKLEDVDNRINDSNIELEDKRKNVEDDSQLTKQNCHFESLSLQCFLNNVVQALERNSGLEDYILTDLMDFCHHNSISLPPICEAKVTASGATGYSDSGSLNSIVEKTEEENQLLWGKITNKLKTGLLNLIKNLPILNSKELYKRSTSPSYAKFVEDRQIVLCKQFLCVFSPETLVDMFCKLRLMQLEDKGSSTKECSVTFTDETSSCIHRSIKLLGKLVSMQVCMMHNDLWLFQSIFSDETFLRQTVHKLLHIYSENLAIHVEGFQDCYRGPQTSFVYGTGEALSEETSKESMFTTSDLRNFSKVFYILHCWSINVQNIMQGLNANSNNLMGQQLDVMSVSSSLDLLVSESSFEQQKQKQEWNWNWRKLFTPYAPVLKSVTPSYIECVCNIVIESRKADRKSETTKMVHVNEKMLVGNCECPIQVTTHCGTLLSLLNEMIVFTVPDEEILFKELSYTALIGLIDGLNIHNTYFEEILQEFEETHSDVNEMYRLLADVSLILIQLKTWNGIISNEEQRNVLQIVINKAQSTLSSCVAVITKYHIGILKCSLLFDDHGNNWEDDRPFFEGERCSFTVQMWSFYIQSVVYDLKSTVAAKYMKQIVWDIGLEVLVLFAQRYSAVKPSFKRQKQFKADILVILSSYKWLLLQVADNLQEVTDMENEKTRLFHSLCKQLLDVMVVTSAPLENVCCYLENTSSCEKNDINSNKHILSWYHQAGIDKTFEYPISLVIDMIVNQKDVDWNLMGHLMMFNNSELPIVLARNAGHLKQPMDEVNHTDMNMNEMFRTAITTSFQSLDEEKFVQDLITLFLRLPKKSFVHFVSSLITEDHSKSFKVRSDQLPLWLRVVSKKLNPILRRILNPALDLLLAESKHNGSPSFAFTKLEKLPCGCPTIGQKGEEKFLSGTKLLLKCLLITLDTLVDSMSLLPSRIWDVLVYVKDQPRFTQSWIKQTNLGTKVLACLLYNWLTEKRNFEHKLNGMTLTTESVESIGCFAELLWHVVYHLTHDVTDNPNISMDLHKDMQTMGERINQRLMDLHEYFDRTSLSYDMDGDVEEEFSRLSISSILSPKNEEELISLKSIFSILKVNQVTIKEMMQSDEDVESLVEKNLTLYKHLNMEKFNILHCFQSIGEHQLNHSDLLERDLSWNELMSFVTLPKWKVLVKNRFEFQDNLDSFLRDDEKETVDKIKNLLNINEVLE